MNRDWIEFNLRETIDELTRTVSELGAVDYSDEEFAVAIAHAYHHLNTAWNGRYAAPDEVEPGSDELFYKWRAFPNDIPLAR
jgi:hypothetical protein